MKMPALVAAGLAVFLLVVAGALVVYSVVVLGAEAGRPASAAPSSQALDDIPVELVPVYEGAAGSCAMPWAVLAAVGKVETDHGRSTLTGVRSGANTAGAMGPMQFLAGTWAAYGVDGDNDGLINVYGPVDAIWGAARYLCANGAADPAQLSSALWNYNHADWYVERVLEVAAGYQSGLASGADVAALVENPNLILTPRARRDLLDGVIDQRVVDFLAWAVARHKISVSVLMTGHSRYVANTTRVSSHWEGRGVDIYAVDGQSVSPHSYAARTLALEVLELGQPSRPTEMGLPWPDLAMRPGVFSDEQHLDHLHVGY